MNMWMCKCLKQPSRNAHRKLLAIARSQQGDGKNKKKDKEEDKSLSNIRQYNPRQTILMITVKKSADFYLLYYYDIIRYIQ